jgi:hypothetical protein
MEQKQQDVLSCVFTAKFKWSSGRIARELGAFDGHLAAFLSSSTFTGTSAIVTKF